MNIYEHFVHLRLNSFKVEKLTHQEEKAMQIIWQSESGFIKDFLAQYEDPKPPYTTLASIVKKLEHKGYIKGKKLGPIIEYKSIISKEEYKHKFMKGFVRDYFKNSYKELVSFFVEEEDIDPKELKEILKMIEK